MRKAQAGFTLIELLIVVAILGILAAVIIPNVVSFIDVGKLNAANTEVANMRTAMMAYYAEYDEFPPNQDSIESYVIGELKGTYTFTGSIITGESYNGFHWNGDTEKWERP